jgi:hypothetical protein
MSTEITVTQEQFDQIGKAAIPAAGVDLPDGAKR